MLFTRDFSDFRLFLHAMLQLPFAESKIEFCNAVLVTQ